ncbi:glycosyltransferase involved in cell wall biosynthesis [Sphingobium sp. OAS761]|uniref:glycosyltransferase family 4 protein n=1 Tax=Sphingobium sp. OAS761 TaxID=2817901 RepID=UPI0020A10EC2|nr:glycosyltransferase family 4 protein [Sphingobium sp. OAS761]MCP1470870.1 glycosyltransferase involved in cell wall biosynthesis [Sphingobium sp. OAS761]
MRVCIVYDCLFPWTIGGAERWYRALAERLAADGHQVTYLTMTQWEEGSPPEIAGVTIVPVAPRAALYEDGKRRIAPPLRFGIGILLHLARHGRTYDVVHLCSFPYFALLAAGLLRPLHGYRIICDWFEIWSRDYWRDYLGRLGWVGATIQWMCARVRQRAHVFSRLHEGRLRALGLNGTIDYLPGLAQMPPHAEPLAAKDPPTILYAGRMIEEKRISLLVDAIAIARRSAPRIQAVLFGNGPDRPRIEARIAKHGLTDSIALPGFVEGDVLEQAMRQALCIVQPSEREGYGLVVVEASARGVPAIVATAPDNAAVELVEPGRNGFIADPPTAQALADALLAALGAGDALRTSTVDWYADNAERLSVESSLRAVSVSYSG